MSQEESASSTGSRAARQAAKQPSQGHRIPVSPERHDAAGDAGASPPGGMRGLQQGRFPGTRPVSPQGSGFSTFCRHSQSLLQRRRRFYGIRDETPHENSQSRGGGSAHPIGTDRQSSIRRCIPRSSNLRQPVKDRVRPWQFDRRGGSPVGVSLDLAALPWRSRLLIGGRPIPCPLSWLTLRSANG